LKKSWAIIALLLLTGVMTLWPLSAYADEVVNTATVTVVQQDDLTTVVVAIETANSDLVVVSQNMDAAVQQSGSVSVTETIANAITTATNAISVASDAVDQAEVAVEQANIKISIADGATATVEQAEANLSLAQQDLVNATADLAEATANVDAQEVIVATDIQNVQAAQSAVDQAIGSAPGLKAEVYNMVGYNNAPPLPETIGKTPVVTTTVTQISFDWGGGTAFNALSEDFIVKFSGNITSQYTGTIGLYAPADDGVILKLDGQTVINDWYDKGGGGTAVTYNVQAGDPIPLTLYYYENGGGAHVNLMWTQGGSWSIVPASAFTTTTGTATQEQLSTLSSAQTQLQSDQTALAGLQQIETSMQNNFNSSSDTLATAVLAVVEAEESETAAIQDANQAIQTAVELSATATQAVEDAGQSVSNLSTVIAQQSAAEEAARQAAIAAEQARLAAEAAARAEAERLRLEAEAKAAAEAAAKAEAERLAAEAKAAEEERLRLEAEAKAAEEERLRLEEEARLAAEAEAKAKAEAEALAKAEEEARIEAERLAAEAAAKAEAERLEAEALAEAERLAEEKARLEAEQKAAEEAAKIENVVKDAEADGVVTEEEKEAIVSSLIEELKPGEALSSEQIQAAGISYSDLPPSTPVDVRTDESGNAVVITAEVAADIELISDPGAFVGELLTDPVAAIAALGSIGADMSPAEREEAQHMVVATVVAAGAAMNAVSVASSGGTTGGSNNTRRS
jgi:PA14 domain